MVRKRSRSSEGSKQNVTPSASSQERRYTSDQLHSLRLQLGTAELAKRMGIPAPSLRRLLGKGKSAGIPKSLLAVEEVKEKIRGARRKKEYQAEYLACKAAVKAYENGTLDLEYMAIAAKYQMRPSRVYTLGVSPDQLGTAT